MSIAETLFAFTQWLRTTPIVDLAIWLSNTRLSVWIGSHFWAIPIIQTIHILSIAAAFGSVLMINLRIVGLRATSSTVPRIMQRFLPWVWWSLALLVVTGIALIIGEPPRTLVNPIFWIKMVLVIALTGISARFHADVRRRMAASETPPDRSIRVTATGLILLWCVVMMCGRWIAYAPV